MALEACDLLGIVERALHASRAEWLFLRELKVGTSKRNGSVQRLDAFALNTLPHTAMKRVCYEVKVSRADFLAELKSPPVDGRANDELIALVARHFGCARARVSIRSGAAARIKVVRIEEG